jgi:hypothetical protein
VLVAPPLAVEVALRAEAPVSAALEVVALAAAATDDELVEEPVT